jgi:hypothetical protein
MGPASVAVQRVVPGDPDSILRRLEHYLTTQEYLQLRRMQPGQALYEPAEDVFSKVARGFTRSNTRFQLAKASRVGVTALPAEGGRARLRIELDLERARHDAFVGGGAGGTAVGFGVGAGLGSIGAFGALALSSGDPVAAVVGGVLLGLAGLGASIAGGIRIARKRFARSLEDAHAEVEGLLDRVQAGERLERPPSPFLRRLRDKFSGIPPLG